MLIGGWGRTFGCSQSLVWTPFYDITAFVLISWTASIDVNKLTELGVSDPHVALQEVIYFLYCFLIKLCRLQNKRFRIFGQVFLNTKVNSSYCFFYVYVYETPIYERDQLKVKAFIAKIPLDKCWFLQFFI